MPTTKAIFRAVFSIILLLIVLVKWIYDNYIGKKMIKCLKLLRKVSSAAFIIPSLLLTQLSYGGKRSLFDVVLQFCNFFVSFMFVLLIYKILSFVGNSYQELFTISHLSVMPLTNLKRF